MVRKRNWGRSNPFSEGHRKCLPGNFCLWDIDGFLLNDDREPFAIYEGKYKMESRDRGNFIDSFYSPRNLQASFLIKTSYFIPVWICEESTGNWWSLNEGILEKSYNPNRDLIKTENRVYVEEILSRASRDELFTGIFVRTEGEKFCEVETFGDFLSSSLKTKKILVNDVFEENLVYFKNSDLVIKSHLDESFSGNWYQDWIDLDII
jgi:hypothetical protein